MAVVLVFNQRALHKASQQSVHLTLGILRTSQAVSYALAFFWLDGFAVPAPAQVTHAVGWQARSHTKIIVSKSKGNFHG